MTIQQVIDFERARAGRDAGIQASVDHADHVHGDWAGSAYSFLAGYAQHNATFTVEDVRLASAGVVPEPPHARSWGAIAVRASREQLIVPIGFTQSKRADGHCMNLRLWQSTVYAGDAA